MHEILALDTVWKHRQPTFTDEFTILLQLVALFACAVVASRSVDTDAFCNITTAIISLAFILVYK